MVAELQVRAVTATQGIMFLVIYNPLDGKTEIRAIGQVIFPEDDWISNSNREVYTLAG